VDVPADVKAGGTFTITPKGSEPIIVAVPLTYKLGDKLKVKLPATHQPPKDHPEPGEWQCEHCTSLNSPAALKGNTCVVCGQASPRGPSLLRACAGARKLRSEEEVEEVERKSIAQLLISSSNKKKNKQTGAEEEDVKEDEDKETSTKGKEEGKVQRADEEDDEDEEDAENSMHRRHRDWLPVGMDLINPTRDIAVYRGACAWLPPPPKDVASGIYQV
jgi:hypothetical protein